VSAAAPGPRDDRMRRNPSPPRPGPVRRDTVQLSPERRPWWPSCRPGTTQVRPTRRPTWPRAAASSRAAPASLPAGPDGKSYAVGGEVNIRHLRRGRDPRPPCQGPADRGRGAGPADPSGQDVSVASQAEAMAAQAQGQLSAGAPGAGGGRGRCWISPPRSLSMYRSPARGPDPCISSARPAGNIGHIFKGLAHDRRGLAPTLRLVAAGPAILR